MTLAGALTRFIGTPTSLCEFNLKGDTIDSEIFPQETLQNMKKGKQVPLMKKQQI